MSIRFYTEVLGFTCGARNNDWGWAALHLDDVEIMLAIPNAHTPFDAPKFTDPSTSTRMMLPNSGSK